LRNKTRVGLVAGYRFGRFFSGVGRGRTAIPVAVAVRMAVTISVARSWGDVDRLAGIGKVGWDGFGYVRDRADLDHRRLGLLQDEFFVDGADLGLLFERLFAARAIFFRRSQWDVVLEVAHAGGIIRVNPERVLETLEIDLLAFGVNLVLPVVLVPLRHGRVLVHVLDDLAPAHPGVVRAEACMRRS